MAEEVAAPEVEPRRDQGEVARAPLPGQTDVMGMWKDVQARADATEQGRRAEMDPAVAAVRQTNQKPLPKAPQLQQVPSAPKANFGEDMMGFMQSAMILGAIGGVLGRKHVTNALQAFSSSIEGFKEGKLTEAKTKMDEWKAETDKVITNNKAMIDQYNAVLKSRQLDLDQKMNEVSLLATQWHDRAAYDAASAKNVTELGRYIEQQQYHTQMLESKRDQMWLQTERLRQSVDQHTAGRLDDTTLRGMAEQIVAGDKSPFQNLGRGTQGAENLARLRQSVDAVAKEKGISPERMAQINAEYQGAVSGQRSLGTQEARVASTIQEAKKTFPLALEAAESVGRGNFVPWNQLKRLVDTKTASAEQARFHVATEGVLTAYSQAMSRGGQGNVHNRQRAESMLDTATSLEAYKAVIGQMEKEMNAALEAPAAARESLRGSSGASGAGSADDPLGLRK